MGLLSYAIDHCKSDSQVPFSVYKDFGLNVSLDKCVVVKIRKNTGAWKR
jgi:hypothetical protein